MGALLREVVLKSVEEEIRRWKDMVVGAMMWLGGREGVDGLRHVGVGVGVVVGDESG